MNKTKFSRLFAAVCLASVGMNPVWADTKTSSFDARVQVSATCGLTSSDLGFPAVTTGNLSNVDTTSSLTVVCSSGTPYQIRLSEGANFNATRRMAWGSNFISYDIFSDSARTQSWSANSVVQGVGSGASQQVPVFGRIFSGQSVPNTGAYADTIVATISY